MNSYLTEKLKSARLGLDSRIQKDELKARLLFLNEKIDDKELQKKYMSMIITGEIHNAEFDDINKKFIFIRTPHYW